MEADDDKNWTVTDDTRTKCQKGTDNILKRARNIQELTLSTTDIFSTASKYVPMVSFDARKQIQSSIKDAGPII